MTRLARGFGLFVILLAVTILVYAVYRQFMDPAFAQTTLGEFWYRMGRETLNVFQAVVQRYVSPDLWDSVIVEILLMPAIHVLITLSAIFGAFGAAVLHFTRRSVGSLDSA